MSFGDEMKKVFKTERKNFPEIFEILCKCHFEKLPLYFKAEKEKRTLRVLHADEESIFNKELSASCEPMLMWQVNVRCQNGEPRLLIELVDPKEAEICEKHLGIHYFPEAFLLENYGITWSDKEF